MEGFIAALESIRDAARSRVRVLNQGVTFYNEEEKARYLQQYESKLRELDRLILNLKPPR